MSNRVKNIMWTLAVIIALAGVAWVSRSEAEANKKCKLAGFTGYEDGMCVTKTYAKIPGQ